MKILLTNTILAVRSTKEFNKSLKKIHSQGKDIEKIKDVVIRLANKEVLDKKFRNHKLINDKYYKNCYECHIKPDLLLIYTYEKYDLVLLLIDIGSHSDLFK